MSQSDPHPPVLYLAVGIGLNSAWSLAPLLGRWGIIAGLILIILGTAIMPPVVARFRRAGTPFNPHKPACALITDGPYRFSRNPAYVALTLWYLGQRPTKTNPVQPFDCPPRSCPGTIPSTSQ